MKTKFLKPLAVVFVCLVLTACVKDTDFDQADDIALTPIVELDLIYFNIEAGEFYDENSDTPILTLSDTTEIRFLDDSGIQESLRRADFYFRFTNSIPRNFEVDFQFISEQNDTTYITGTNVIEGTLENPVITEFEQVVEGDDILQLTMADRVVVSVTIPDSDPTLEGILNLKSKTTYYLEVRDRE
ncbi:hypothetical protein J1N09_09850 [Aureitalea sp. L0-47]|uniref:hypothetical protein n=1 Tax=Aureitalea sp. L0-47 TaxID=2816962 RepID=UPI002236F4A5|nr:hypothetical protein [Aureitalea sp. L0-47]MCW5520142.1 hypothetical protein [Aureitalea sp. L0-47]